MDIVLRGWVLSQRGCTYKKGIANWKVSLYIFSSGVVRIYILTFDTKSSLADTMVFHPTFHRRDSTHPYYYILVYIYIYFSPEILFSCWLSESVADMKVSLPAISRQTLIPIQGEYTRPATNRHLYLYKENILDQLPIYTYTYTRRIY